MKALFIASFGIISSHPQANKKLFVDDLGLPLEDPQNDGYLHSEKIGGAKHFGLWPLTQAAQACFGTDTWPSSHPVPQTSVEFEVADAKSVEDAAAELQAKDHRLLHATRTEPWGQTVARLQTKEGAIVGISYAPWLHNPA
jgi:hypothetical protein